MEIVATNVVANRPPERRLTGTPTTWAHLCFVKAADLMKDPVHVHTAVIMLNCTALLIPTSAELFIAAEIPGYNCSVRQY